MSPIAAYFWGIVTVLIILFCFWLVAASNSGVGNLYASTVCAGVV